MDQNEVAIAFDIVLEEIENAIAALNQQGAQAFQSGKYEVARDLTEKGSQMAVFRTKVADLQREWLQTFDSASLPRPRATGNRIGERLKRGLRTREDAFRIPVLESLVELGGCASMADVLARVEAKMRDFLNEYDLSPLPSDPSQIRWRNTAQWAKKAMVTEGLIAPDTPRGTWQITEDGRRWLDTIRKQNRRHSL